MPDWAEGGGAKLAILHGHYEESCRIAVETRIARDRSCWWMMACVLFVLFERGAPGEFFKVAAGVLSKHVNGVTLELQFISVFLWLSALVSAIRYYQCTVRLEQEYKYLHSLEDLLAPNFPSPAFTREGKAYLKKYPLISSWVHLIYCWLLPLLLLFVAATRLLAVLALPTWQGAHRWDMAVSILMVITVLLDLCPRVWGRIQQLFERLAGRGGHRRPR